MVRLTFAVLTVSLLAGCNVDVVLPANERTTDEVVVIDLNARTQNRAVVDNR